MQELAEHPGLLFVAATLLPLASFVILLLLGAKRWALRPHIDRNPAAKALFHLLGGDVPGRGPAYVALAAIALAFVCSLAGFVFFLGEHHHLEHEIAPLRADIKALDAQRKATQDFNEVRKLERKIHDLHEKVEDHELHFEHRWAGSFLWARVAPQSATDADQGTRLSVGYRIDHLAGIMFVMVTFIASLIHLFSIGYMSDELKTVVEDHEVHTEHGHYHRRGRFGRFFMFLSLFCFSMLNLVLADNLFQVFVSWELVGVCSFLLIGFYFERTSASNAANKAFITNRVGDAGFIIGLLIIWTYIGSFNFQDVARTMRAPEQAAHQKAMPQHDQIVRVQPVDGFYRADPNGPAVLLFDHHAHAPREKEGVYYYEAAPHGHPVRTMPTWMLIASGLGIFLGCAGKSAQFPLQVWLPDAMEGPTPVSALIHAATMVAAGVYLVGRCYFLFTPEVLLTIAYVGAITLFIAATIAIVMTDIKKVLAYSTVSQLGFMMLALGVGGWAAGLFHLVTHAFFKALLFLGSGSVIYGCHHEQDMRKMGGLFPKMKITALTMLMGVLAIAGTPLFSGWYSKDAVLAHALGFGLANPQHMLLFILPIVTAGITTFYMFRMWFMTFTGPPKDEHVQEHAHESPWMMTVPLVVLAFFSVTVAWGWPIWDAEASALEHTLHHAQPASVVADFGDPHSHKPTPAYLTHENHGLAGMLAALMMVIGLSFGATIYYYGMLDPEDAHAQFPGVHRFLQHKWYFDELYSALLVRPALRVAGWCRAFDTYVIDGFVHLLGRSSVSTARESGRFDRGVIDGLANLIGDVCYSVGAWFRNIQTGYLRSYVLFLVLAAVGIWVVLSLFLGPAAGAP